MQKPKFDLYELGAIERAGEKAGAYAERIGKTDLATMSRQEWADFCALMIDSFGRELAGFLASEEAPF